MYHYEQDIHAEFENLAGSADNAFAIMRAWNDAQGAASGNKFTLQKHLTVDVDKVFRNKTAGYNKKAVEFYLEHIA